MIPLRDETKEAALDRDVMNKSLKTRHPGEMSGEKRALEEDISIHIFTTSATMVGVCLTVIGLLRLILQARSVSTWVDDLLSIDAMLFLSACGLAYWALRMRSVKRRLLAERIADVVFLFALVLMATICALITYTLV
ncbi:MAG: hypothetical protein QOJ64_73 [Acidobacteriota bacterium]|jgi:hypothetical protein|nr:hypothetical protein [Acidobacteriota bacterium]